MKTYLFDISSDAIVTREVLDAADDAAAIRQAILLMSEIMRDHALSSHGVVALTISVRDVDGRTIWSGEAYAQA